MQRDKIFSTKTERESDFTMGGFLDPVNFSFSESLWILFISDKQL